MSRKEDFEMHTFSLLIIIHVFISITSTGAMSRKDDFQMHTFFPFDYHSCFYDIYTGYEQKV